MPNQDNTNQNSNQGVSPNIPFSPQADLPPLPPEFQNLTTPTVERSNPKTDSGSATPPVPEFSNITANPKKKFGTGKIIATILGVLALVGSIGTGTYLVSQKQIFQQKAATGSCSGFCSTNGNCPEGSRGDGSGTNGGNGCNVGQYCCIGNGTPKPTGQGAWCTDNGYSCVAAADCPAGKSQTGNCVAAGTVCCDVASPTSGPKTGWGIGKSCKNTSGTGDHCIIIRCPNGCSGGCSENDPGATFQSGNCDTLAGQVGSICGQVDLVNASGVYCQSDGTFTDAQINCPQPKCAITSNPTNPPTNPPSNPPTTPPTPTSSPVAPYCAAIHVYDSEWNVISTADLSKLVAGTTINFCVSGAAPSGTFDMARFTINGNLQSDTTDLRPESTDICQQFTIPENTDTFAVSAQIHHATLGWF